MRMYKKRPRLKRISVGVNPLFIVVQTNYSSAGFIKL